MNIAIISGRLVAEPELRTTQSGTSMTKFTVAVERRFVAKGQDKKSDFISCIAWGKTAEFVSKYFAKGAGIELHGEIITGSYEDKNGVKRYTTDVNVATVEFPKGAPKASKRTPAARGEEPVAVTFNTDDFEEIEDGVVVPF